MTLADAAVIVASILAVGSLVPQAVRLLRTRDVVGVSVLWTALGTVTNLAWFAYALARGLWAGGSRPPSPPPASTGSCS